MENETKLLAKEIKDNFFKFWRSVWDFLKHLVPTKKGARELVECHSCKSKSLDVIGDHTYCKNCGTILK